MTSTIRPGGEADSLAEQAKEHVQDAAHDVKGQTREKLGSQLADRSTELGDQATSAARAMHQASSHLRQEGNERAASLFDGAADHGQRLGQYLRDADGDKLLRDVEEFARRQPWIAVTASTILGFLGARFVKASSHGRYRANGGPGSLVNGGARPLDATAQPAASGGVAPSPYPGASRGLGE